MTERSHDAGAFARSGASGGKTGVAGSVAVVVARGSTAATLGNGAAIIITDGAADADALKNPLFLAAEARSTTSALALPDQNAKGSSTGVGLSFAIAVGDYDTTAQMQSAASVSGAEAVTLLVVGAHGLGASARAGAAADGDSGTAVGGAVALSVGLNSTVARVDAGAGLLDVNDDLTIVAAAALTPEGDPDIRAVLGALLRGTARVGDLIRLGRDSSAAFAALARCRRALGPGLGLPSGA